MVERVSISLDDDQIKLIENIKGYGNKKAEVVKNLMMAYLSEKGYLEEFNKSKRKK